MFEASGWICHCTKESNFGGSHWAPLLSWQVSKFPRVLPWVVWDLFKLIHTWSKVWKKEYIIYSCGLPMTWWDVCQLRSTLKIWCFTVSPSEVFCFVYVYAMYCISIHQALNNMWQPFLAFPAPPATASTLVAVDTVAATGALRHFEPHRLMERSWRRRSCVAMTWTGGLRCGEWPQQLIVLGCIGNLAKWCKMFKQYNFYY